MFFKQCDREFCSTKCPCKDLEEEDELCQKCAKVNNCFCFIYSWGALNFAKFRVQWRKVQVIECSSELLFLSLEYTMKNGTDKNFKE